MIRLSTLFWLLAVSAAGFAMYAVKYEVQALADEHTRIVKQADDAERDLRVLEAEWAYLNRPEALAQMNQRFLSLGPIATKQLRSSLSDIPMRPAPAPALSPVETVAADGPALVADAGPMGALASAAPSAPPTEPAAVEGQAQTRAEQATPSDLAQHVITVSLDMPAARAEPAKLVSAKSAVRSARPIAPHRPRSLDELIAQVTESR